MIWQLLSTLSLSTDEYEEHINNHESEKLKLSLTYILVLQEYWGFWFDGFIDTEYDEFFQENFKTISDAVWNIMDLMNKRKIKMFVDLKNANEWNTICEIAKNVLMHVGAEIINPPSDVDWEEWIDWYEYGDVITVLKIK